MYKVNASKSKKSVIGTTITVIMVCLVSLLPLAYSQNINPSLFPIDSSPYGVSNADFSIKWWKWLMEIPQDQNPANDPTGAHCAINQNEANVWFITGTLSGSAERTCNIPAGKALFLGDGIECSTIENPEAKTDDQLQKCATDGLQAVRDPTSLKASIDGVPLKNLDQYRVKSQAFDVTFPAHNIWGVKGGPTRSAADTYIVFLKPLPPGKHVFTFSASSPVTPPSLLKPNPEPPHALAIKYNLIVGK
jgi:hypothetical protein